MCVESHTILATHITMSRPIYADTNDWGEPPKAGQFHKERRGHNGHGRDRVTTCTKAFLREQNPQAV
jgi:hypothetical protein